MASRIWIGVLGLALGVNGCGGDTTSPPPPPPPPSATIDCGTVAPVSLAPGDHQTVDPAANNGCVRVPAAGAGGAEYIVVAASTASTRTPNGVSGPFLLRSANPGEAASASRAAPAAPPVVRPPAPISNAARFDWLLRRKEVELAKDPSIRLARPAAPPVPAPVPVVGDVRTFKTCADLDCNQFNDVVATARYVGTNAAIYMDNSVPQSDTLKEVDYEDLGRTFDTYHYPIDTTAFGRESDVDNNGRVVILMTDAVNSLTPDCTGGRVLGYFFGLDLTLTGSQAVNSNKAEVFYTLVPSPATTDCDAVSRTQAIRSVKPTLIHELQHMISWNQHVLIRNGNSEETWLNEGLSHFAEELGGRQIPNSECANDGFSSCRSQYISGDIINGYDFAANSESHFLVAPSNSTGTLEERGSAWMFVRWVLDQFAAVPTLGTDLTRALLQTNLTGVANITGRTGGSFSEMVPEWLLTIFLDDLPGFVPTSPRLAFASWGLRSIWTNPANQSSQDGPFDGFPLVPDSTGGASSHSGFLKAGSGYFLRLIQPSNGPPIDVQLVRDATGAAIDPALVARLGIARVR